MPMVGSGSVSLVSHGSRGARDMINSLITGAAGGARRREFPAELVLRCETRQAQVQAL